MIPDFGESDVLHLNLPLKEILSDSLKHNLWPLWTDLLMGGFPVLAEGQIGTFYFPNLLFFKFLPLIPAYNLSLTLSFFISSIGMYLFSRKIKLGILPSLFATLIFTYSGYFAVHLNHFNLIEAASLFPLITYAFLRFWLKFSILNLFFLAFLISQQIFTGHFYIVFITLSGLIIISFGLLLFSKNKKTNKIVLLKSGSLLLSFILAIIMSAIQAIPTLELMSLSSRRDGLSFETVTSFPYPIKHLLSFINPYFFGSPQNATYPVYSNNWGIYWENTAYIGLIPLILAGFSLIIVKNKAVKIMLILLIISLLLVLGKNSPLYFIFSLPPFNFFRVPSKFLLLTVFSISVLSAYVLNKLILKIKQNKLTPHRSFLLYVVYISLFALFCFDEFSFSYKYPPLSAAKIWLKAPKTLKLLDDNTFRLITYGDYLDWNRIFLNSGWQDMKDYLPFKNSLAANYNIFFKLNNSSINTGGLVPRRSAFWKSLFDEVTYNETENTFFISPRANAALKIWGVDTIISTFRLDNNDWKIFNEINPVNSPTFYIYKHSQSRKLAYFADSSVMTDTFEDFYVNLSEINDNSVLSENNSLIKFNNPDNASVELISKSTMRELYGTDSKTQGLLVLNKSLYPGWTALLDGKPVRVFNVNLNQPAIIIPEGKHQLDFWFESKSFKMGKTITITAYFIAFSTVFLSSLRFSGRSKAHPLPASYH